MRQNAVQKPLSMLDVIQSEIHNIIVNEEEFEVRQPILYRYKEILETMVLDDSHNIEAYCLLAMIAHELRLSVDVSIGYLTECYQRNRLHFAKEEYAIWATNMAYFYLEESSEDSLAKAKALIEQAVSQELFYPQTYYAYGRILYELNEFEKAANQFHKCYSLTKEKRYRYNEAVSLIKCSKHEQAIALLKDIQSYPFKTKLDAKINCVLGQQLALTGRRLEAKNLANQLYVSSYHEFSINEMELADFMYQIEEYDRAKELYEQCSQYLIETDWISRYFYVLYKLELKQTAIKKMKAIKKGIRYSLLDVKHHKSLFDEITERDEYIEIEKQRLKDIKEGYSKIFEQGVKPEINVRCEIQYFCFYIGCPRHVLN